jgi:phospholipid transport system substrate-binding protein
MRRLAALILLALLLAPAPPRAAEPEAALATAERLVEGAHGALTEDGLGAEARDARLKETIAAAFAFDIWERFLLGDRAETFSGDQLAEFRALLPGFLADLYKTQFGKGLEEKPEIIGTRPARRDVLVRARIPRAEQDPLPVDWRIRDFGERGHEVIDVMVGGISFLVLKREEFASLLERGGPDALLAHMRANSL